MPVAKKTKALMEEQEKEKTLSTQAEHSEPTENGDFEEETAEVSSGNASSASGTGAGSTQTTGSESSASFKNFRHHPDMENFYRFIYDNDLRHEALAIIDEMMMQKNKRKILKGQKTNAH